MPQFNGGISNTFWNKSCQIKNKSAYPYCTQFKKMQSEMNIHNENLHILWNKSCQEKNLKLSKIKSDTPNLMGKFLYFLKLNHVRNIKNKSPYLMKQILSRKNLKLSKIWHPNLINGVLYLLKCQEGQKNLISHFFFGLFFSDRFVISDKLVWFE